MGEDRLIRKIQMDCPLCDKTHEVEERSRIATIEIKGMEVSYEETYFRCGNCDEEENEFDTGEVLNTNLLNARDAYRRKAGLLTSGEIVEIRDNYGLSQVDLARLLGWGESTVARYETKAIQDKAYDTMLRLIRDNPLKALELLKKNGEQISSTKKEAIRNKIIERLDTYGKEYLSRQAFEGEYANFDVPSDSNGYTLLNIDKIEVIISYFAKAITNLYKTKLMKMLWYADALSFIRYDHAMTGMVYRHETLGALPIGHYSLMNLENLNVKEESSVNYDTIIHIYSNEKMNYDLLSNDEKRVLDDVIAKFKSWKAKEIVDYMHAEKAYKNTTQGDIIPFSLAKEIRAF